MKRFDRGFVLVSVLWVLAILTVIALGFGRRAYLDRAAATYSIDRARAMHLARGSITLGIVELRNKASKDAQSETEGRTSYMQSWAKPVDLVREGGYFTSLQAEESENDICGYVIRDEQSLVSLNAAPDEMLSEVEGLTPGILRKINARRRGSPEDEEPAQPFQTLEELRFLEGISDRDWFGTDRKLGLKDMLTCFGGDGRINVNTASEEVLRCVPKLEPGVAKAIVQYRNGPDGEPRTGDDRDFTSIEDLIDKVGGRGDSTPLNNYCTVNSGVFTITGVATLHAGKVRASCVATVYVTGGNAYVIKWREEFLDS